ncbi:MAG: UDP-N-acetylglucosamine 2-epimerase (non-hydrolyzing) [Austwickia sp.]|nr:UDP-N-acetylglucosamine 2-epimerase (non-hydrolyzing) [Austwickia sp.]MBK8437621.1 UDP-N-acetylglucosamine 2-epimerase (non-hydrolyzing) [Austwickia sp.]MBK9102931.1 UDP-N-acetylglucosamine 2-epimerase (non-hydrolyzing) [Austwickia sp.]
MIDRPLVMFVYGTRPEAIKMAPLVQLTAQSARLAAYVVVTGQHRSMLDQVNEAFGIVPDADLDIFEPGQGIESIVAKTLTSLTSVIREVQPGAVVVHGDTSTAFAAAQAAFYLGVPVIHLEAGLRTNDLTSPFPEEANRQLIGRLAALHLAPTGRNRASLLAENVDPDTIVVTGNTVIDALQQMAARVTNDGTQNSRPPANGSRPAAGTAVATDDPEQRRRQILVTMHRRENLGQTMTGIARALARIAQSHPDVDLLVPLHLNPAVRASVVPTLAHVPNVTITDPMGYTDFVAELTRCDLVVTDSGGLQEEGPGLGKPVLVIRNTTERPEAIEAGTVRLIGVEEEDIVAAVNEVLDDPAVYERMATAVNPYGDGLASPRCLAAIEELLGVGLREPDFVAHEGSLTRRLRHLTGLPRTATRTKRASSA